MHGTVLGKVVEAIVFFATLGVTFGFIVFPVVSSAGEIRSRWKRFCLAFCLGYVFTQFMALIAWFFGWHSGIVKTTIHSIIAGTIMMLLTRIPYPHKLRQEHNRTVENISKPREN